MTTASSYNFNNKYSIMYYTTLVKIIIICVKIKKEAMPITALCILSSTVIS